MIIERFEPDPSQLSRLAPQEYEELIVVTLRELARVDSESTLPDIEGLSQDEIAAIIQEERTRLESQTKSISQRVLDGGTLEDFERDMARAVADAMLLLLLFAVGGVRRLQSSAIARQFIRRHNILIQNSARSIKGLADKIASGQLTPGQISAYANRRSADPIADFYASELLDRIANQGHNEALRVLDPSARHCPDCPAYETTDWVPIGDVVPVGWACICGGRCYCTVYTRFNPGRAIQELQGGSLVDQVANAISRQDEALAIFRGRYGFEE